MKRACLVLSCFVFFCFGSAYLFLSCLPCFVLYVCMSFSFWCCLTGLCSMLKADMNEDSIAALDQIVRHDVGCWLATLPVPHRYGESNLFAREPVFFRKKKRVEGDAVGYSRKQTRGILIPTSSPAVLEEWINVRKQVQLWAWEVSPIVSGLPLPHHRPNSLLNQP